jgi:hypothetical protein
MVPAQQISRRPLSSPAVRVAALIPSSSVVAMAPIGTQGAQQLSIAATPIRPSKRARRGWLLLTAVAAFLAAVGATWLSRRDQSDVDTSFT